MTTIGIIPEEYEALLSAPHVVLTVLAHMQFASGELRLHPGTGTLEAGGLEWQGVTDPGQTRVVKIGPVQLPEVNVASKVDLTLTGVDTAFLRETRRIVTSRHREVEGRRADLYLAVFRPGTDTAVTPPLPLFTNGRMTAPSFRFDGIGNREVTVGIEGVFSAKNFAPGGRYTTADQRRRYPGTTDRFFEYVGAKLSYRWPK
ncbi:hypothetical protein [Mongoliimonas terrestris]|uniref:hypothetical protein n=1 Tax=Mongoliimonas terrestris TaxID=1709001 RepID=UPI0009F84B12|nr:hypothetical protein [Mongoliimonas terrestris]